MSVVLCLCMCPWFFLDDLYMPCLLSKFGCQGEACGHCPMVEWAGCTFDTTPKASVEACQKFLEVANCSSLHIFFGCTTLCRGPENVLNDSHGTPWLRLSLRARAGKHLSLSRNETYSKGGTTCCTLEPLLGFIMHDQPRPGVKISGLLRNTLASWVWWPSPELSDSVIVFCAFCHGPTVNCFLSSHECKVGELLQKQLEEHRQHAFLKSDEGMDFCDDTSSDSDDSGLESLVNGKNNRSGWLVRWNQSVTQLGGEKYVLWNVVSHLFPCQSSVWRIKSFVFHVEIWKHKPWHFETFRDMANLN